MGPAHVQADVGHFHATGETRAVTLQEPGLQCRERDRQVRREGPRRRPPRCHRRHRRGCRRPAHPPREARTERVGAPEARAVGGVDDEVHRPRRPDARRGAVGLEHLDRCATTPDERACNPPVCTVVAPARYHHHPPAVGATHHPDPPRAERRARLRCTSTASSTFSRASASMACISEIVTTGFKTRPPSPAFRAQRRWLWPRARCG